MSVTLGVLSFFTGLGLFLFGMQLLEAALKALSSESFKQILRRSTSNPFTSMLAGTLTTMVVQSSSMVGLMMMAFVGAGVIPLANAVGVVLGANLGTTFTGWIVATLGFKLKLTAFALPCMGLGALFAVVFESREKFKSWALLVLGFGLLLFGLDAMKTSMEALAARFDIALLQGYPTIVYLLVGVVFTAVIQSSSAAMMITLSALHVGIVDLHSAAALVVGADLGTSSTMILGGFGASAVKKQLALAQVLINVITATMAFSFLPLLLRLVQQGYSLEDPLLALVAFHSTFNLIGIALILPFSGRLSRYLATRFLGSEQDVRTYINNVPAQEVEEALIAVRKEIECLLLRICALTLRNFKLEVEVLPVNHQLLERMHSALPADKTYLDSYAEIKKLEGEILEFAGLIQVGRVSTQQVQRLHELLSAARHGVYAAKSMKDIRENLAELRHSANPALTRFYESQVALHKSVLTSVLQLAFGSLDAAAVREERLLQQNRNRDAHLDTEKQLFTRGLFEGANEHETSTLLNVNREFRAATDNLFDMTGLLRSDSSRMASP